MQSLPNITGKRIAALKIFPMTPYADWDTMHEVMTGILAAKPNVDRKRHG